MLKTVASFHGKILVSLGGGLVFFFPPPSAYLDILVNNVSTPIIQCIGTLGIIKINLSHAKYFAFIRIATLVSATSRESDARVQIKCHAVW